MTRGRWLVAALLAGLVLALAVVSVMVVRRVFTTPPPAPDYGKGAAWLCLPGRSDPCGTPTTTLFDKGGTRRIETVGPDAAAPIDCFYVYPTVSGASTAYAPIAATAREVEIARRQIAPFSSVCRTFAPLYRQVTAAGLGALFRGSGVTLDMPYSDVVAAWHRYLAKDNGGRRFVLIGHSQGSRLLAKLMAAEIDGKPIQSKLIAAIIPGAAIDVPVGKDVGGTFAHIPLCHGVDEPACAIAYSTYPAARPMPAKARFGATTTPGMRNACVDPSRLAGTPHLDARIPPPAKMKAGFGTDFVAAGAVTGSCRWDGRFSVLAIDAGRDAPGGMPAEELIDKSAPYYPETGFHSIDLELGLGTLLDLIRRKAAAAT